jgi:hypothetical protein
MFSVKIQTTPIFIMDDIGNVSQGIDVTLIYNGCRLQFIEKDGFYAYNNFFKEGIWPDEYYNDSDNYNIELSSPYQGGIWLKMINGGWSENLTNLIQTLGFVSISIDDIEDDESEILSFITRLKNGEGIRRHFYVEDEIFLKNYEGEYIEELYN